MSQLSSRAVSQIIGGSQIGDVYESERGPSASSLRLRGGIGTNSSASSDFSRVLRGTVDRCRGDQRIFSHLVSGMYRSSLAGLCIYRVFDILLTEDTLHTKTSGLSTDYAMIKTILQLNPCGACMFEGHSACVRLICTVPIVRTAPWPCDLAHCSAV
jgi:hypothetical protein